MTLPASGQIAVSQISTELGLASTATDSLSFINSKTKAAYQQSSPSMNNYYSKAYYQKNNAGNCNNGNCACACACACDCECQRVVYCQNCNVCNAINCANCDSQAYLQPNCNCACTYNCSTTGTFPIACDCACACNCDCGG